MGSSRMMIKVACVMFMCMVVFEPKAAEAAPAPTVSCNQVVSSLRPCVGYVIGGGQVPMDCCSGVRGIWNAARTTQDRQGICSCLQQTVRGIALPAYSLALVAGLPARCGVNIPYQISPNTDCKRLK